MHKMTKPGFGPGHPQFMRGALTTELPSEQLNRRRGDASRRRCKIPVTSHCSVAMIWVADIYAVITYSSDEGESTGEGENPHYIKACLTHVHCS